MKSILKNNFLFRGEEKVREICKPAFDKFDLQYFSYGKFYKDGRCVLLSTNKNVFINHFKQGYELTVFPEESNSLRSIYNLIFIENDSPDIIIDEYNLFDHGTMIDLLRINDEHYEMFCYVSKDKSVKPVNKFLNHLDFLDNFCNEFLVNSKDILKNQCQEIVLPDSMRPKILENPSEINKNRNIHLGLRSVNLSERQYQCLSLLCVGKTSKEIASSLNLSYRTVETHIDILK